MQNQNENFPNQWSCPISQQLMTDPVIAEDGFSYQRASIENWFKTSNMSPITGLILSTTNLIQNRALKQTIELFLQKMKTQDKKIKDQKKLELERDILRMQEELKKKKQDFSQLGEQINKIEQKLTETKRNLQKIVKVDHELSLKSLKAKNSEKAKQKQDLIDIEKHPKYGKYFQLLKGKMKLNLFNESVTDKRIEKFLQFQLSKIKILSLGYNQVTDYGFGFLFQDREWPVLQEIYLDNNKIQNIHSLHKITNLLLLSLDSNELSQASCTYLCENQLSKLTNLGISFKVGINDTCWEKLLPVMPQNFPKLEDLFYEQKEDISKKNQKKIKNYCKNRQIKLNSG